MTRIKVRRAATLQTGRRRVGGWNRQGDKITCQVLGLELPNVTMLCNWHSLSLIFFCMYLSSHNLTSRKTETSGTKHSDKEVRDGTDTTGVLPNNKGQQLAKGTARGDTWRWGS